MRSGAGHRALERIGREITIRNFTQSGTDDYGDPTYDESDSTVTARVERGTAFDVIREVGGDELTAEYIITVKDTVDIVDTQDDGRNTEFIDDSRRFRVAVSDDQDNGVIRCLCRTVT